VPGSVTELLGCAPGEVVFTGGDSDSDTVAIRGAALAHRDRGDHPPRSPSPRGPRRLRCAAPAARLPYHASREPSELLPGDTAGTPRVFDRGQAGA
jgi:hypothetical protein